MFHKSVIKRKTAEVRKIYYYKVMEGIMTGLFVIFLSVVLMAVPGFYIITRKMFPKMSKRTAGWITCLLTVLLVAALSLMVWST